MAKRNLDLDNLPDNSILPWNGTDNEAPKVKARAVKKESKRTVADDVKDISSGLFETVILPTVKSLITEFVNTGIQMLVWGDRPNNNFGSRYSGGYTNYSQRHFTAPTDRRSPRVSRGTVDTIYYDSRRDAEYVLGKMIETIARYGWATVGDLYSLSGLTGTPLNETYGWTNLSSATIINTMDGFVIDLPVPEYSRR